MIDKWSDRFFHERFKLIKNVFLIKQTVSRTKTMTILMFILKS